MIDMIHKSERKFTWDVTQLRPLYFTPTGYVYFFPFSFPFFILSSFLIGLSVLYALNVCVKENVINGTWIWGWIASDFDDTTKHFHKSKNISKSEHAEWQIVVIHCLLLQTEKHTHIAIVLVCVCVLWTFLLIGNCQIAHAFVIKMTHPLSDGWVHWWKITMAMLHKFTLFLAHTHIHTQTGTQFAHVQNGCWWYGTVDLRTLSVINYCCKHSCLTQFTQWSFLLLTTK